MSRRNREIEACIKSAEHTVDKIAEELNAKNSMMDLRTETGLAFEASMAMLNQNRAIILLLKDLGERLELVETSLGVIRDGSK